MTRTDDSSPYYGGGITVRVWSLKLLRPAGGWRCNGIMVCKARSEAWTIPRTRAWSSSQSGGNLLPRVSNLLLLQVNNAKNNGLIMRQK